MSLAVAQAAPAEILSPTQVRCFTDCQVRWWFKYYLKYPDPPSARMALGRAIHAALAANFTEKMETHEDLPTLGVVALFREAWVKESEQVEVRDDEDPIDLASYGVALVAKYMDEAAPRIEPAAVETRIEGQIAGVRVQGWVDILDIHGRIIDIKTSARRPNAIDPGYRFQIATYTRLTPGASGEARLDTLVKTKTPGLITQSFMINDQDLLAIEKLYPLALQAMRSDIFMPNRLSISCSRRNCSYWRRCEREWGGEVPKS